MEFYISVWNSHAQVCRDILKYREQTRKPRFFGPPRIWLTKLTWCGIQSSGTHTHTLNSYMIMCNLFKDSLNYFVCSGGIRVMQKILEGVCKKYPRHCLGGGFIGDWGAASGKFSRPEGVPWPAGHRKHPRPVRGKQTGKSLEIRSMRVLKSF